MTTDTILRGVVAPALLELRDAHPLLNFELHTGNELTSLTRRDADIAVRATKRPPQHLVGKNVGPIRMALYAARRGPVRSFADVEAGGADWIAPDDALPEHPSVVWRKRRFYTHLSQALNLPRACMTGPAAAKGHGRPARVNARPRRAPRRRPAGFAERDR